MQIFEEVIHSIQHNKVRSILAGFGVAWGIFILMLLLGTGKGFQEGIFNLFGIFAKNSFFIYGGQVAENTAINTPFKKQILFSADDISIIKQRFRCVDAISPEVNFNGNLIMTSKYNRGYFQLKGVMPDYFKVKTIHSETGRQLNVLDNNEKRHTVYIGRQVADVLFPKMEALGKEIDINGNSFRVIGIIKKGSLFSQGEQGIAYIPYNTIVECFNQGRVFNCFIFRLDDSKKTIGFENIIKTYLARKYSFSVDDKSALYITNTEVQMQAFGKLFKAIDLFLWIIGICLLVSGIVGISNIMLVIVKERTSEIGIRKAIGAPPGNILNMIIGESVAITALAGIIGMVLGILVIGGINWVIGYFWASNDLLFTKATIDVPVIIGALTILILAGVLAGLYPAIKAVNITPVEAIRLENS